MPLHMNAAANALIHLFMLTPLLASIFGAEEARRAGAPWLPSHPTGHGSFAAAATAATAATATAATATAAASAAAGTSTGAGPGSTSSPGSTTRGCARPGLRLRM